MTSRRLRRFEITHELLTEILLLPAGARVEQIAVSPDLHDAAQITVSAPDFDELKDGDEIPVCNPLYRNERIARFDGWGI
jgi:hypothetical protein